MDCVVHVAQRCNHIALRVGCYVGVSWCDGLVSWLMWNLQHNGLNAAPPCGFREYLNGIAVCCKATLGCEALCNNRPSGYAVGRRGTRFAFLIGRQVAGPFSACEQRFDQRLCNIKAQGLASRCQTGIARHAMASDGKRKRARSTRESLQRMLHTGGISIVGLADLLKTLREGDCPDVLNASRFALRTARHSLFEDVQLAFELPLVGGGTFCWEMIDPLKMLMRAVELRGDFRALVGATFRRSPPSAESPWHLVIGFDAFVPGR